MIRIFLLLLLLLIPCHAQNYNAYCCNKTAAKTFSGVLSSASGVNFLARQIAQREIAKAFKKETNSNFKVKINSFWGTNILNGELSSFSAFSKNYQDNNFSSHNLNLKTVCPYNKISYKNDKLIFDTNVVLKFDTELDEDDLSKMMKQKVQFENDKITFNYKISLFGIKASTKIKAGLKVVDNKLHLCNVEIKNKSINASKYLSLFNPTNFDINLDKNTKAKIKVEGINIENSKVYLSGYAIIPQTKDKEIYK